MPIHWDPKFETSDQKIDDQHRKLFDWINKLEAMRDAPEINKIQFDSAMSFLSMFTNVHFSYEECVMAVKKCPVADKNREAHGKFLQAFEGYKRRYQTEGPTKQLLTELCDVASNWIAAHICRIDVNLRQCAGVGV